MAMRWLIRLVLGTGCGAILVWIVGRWLPHSQQQGDYTYLSVVLTCLTAAFTLADVAWPLLNRKLDEQLSASSPLSSKQKSIWRIDALTMERDYFALFLCAVTLKAVVLAIGGLLYNKAIPAAYCAQSTRAAVFLIGCALPTLIIMPSAYFSVRRAKIDLARYEEEETDRRKALEVLRTAPEYDFKDDPHFAGYSRVIHPES